MQLCLGTTETTVRLLIQSHRVQLLLFCTFFASRSKLHAGRVAAPRHQVRLTPVRLPIQSHRVQLLLFCTFLRAGVNYMLVGLRLRYTGYDSLRLHSQSKATGYNYYFFVLFASRSKLHAGWVAAPRQQVRLTPVRLPIQSHRVQLTPFWRVIINMFVQCPSTSGS